MPNKTKTTPRRDGISFRDFLPLTVHGIEQMTDTFDIADMEYQPIEEWAKLFFLMRQMPDNDNLFPSGKWATIQALESKLDEWAVGVVTAVNPKGTLP